MESASSETDLKLTRTESVFFDGEKEGIPSLSFLITLTEFTIADLLFMMRISMAG